jgi:hypothetical protein
LIIALSFLLYCFWIPLCYLQSFPTFIPLLVIDVKLLSTLFNAFLWPHIIVPIIDYSFVLVYVF